MMKCVVAKVPDVLLSESVRHGNTLVSLSAQHSQQARRMGRTGNCCILLCSKARRRIFLEPFLHDIASMQGHFSHSHVVVDASFQHLQKRMLGRHSFLSHCKGIWSPHLSHAAGNCM